MNIQAQKALLIEQLKQLDDVNLIKAIQNLIEYALKKEEEGQKIPQAHQKLVNTRYKKVQKDPDRLMDWNEAKENLGS